MVNGREWRMKRKQSKGSIMNIRRVFHQIDLKKMDMRRGGRLNITLTRQ
jgi:hypothetical protein